MGFKLKSQPMVAVTLLLSSLMLVSNVLGQETTGGLQGTVKDSTGAVVSSAHVEITGTALAGNEALDTDSAGYSRFANLPPGTYVIAVSAKGFKSVKREGVTLEVGHLPTLDLTLEVGAAAEVLVFKRSFRDYVLAHFDENDTAPMPILYRLA